MKYIPVMKIIMLSMLIPAGISLVVKAESESITAPHKVDRRIGVYYSPEVRNYEYLYHGPKPELFQLGPVSIALFNTILQSTFQKVTVIDNFPPLAEENGGIDGILVPRIKSFEMKENKSAIPMYSAEISYEFNLYKPDGVLITSWEVKGSGEAQSKPLFYHPQWPGLATDKAMEKSVNRFMESFRENPDLTWWSHDQKTRYSSKDQGMAPVHGKPRIGSIIAPQILSGGEMRGNIWVGNITSAMPIDHVWAVIIPPSEWKQTSHILSLDFNNKNNRYEGNFPDFTLHGDYTAAVFVRDAQGNTSIPKSTKITQTILSGADAYENDDTPAQAVRIWLNDNKPQRHNFYTGDDVDWIFFVALKGVDYSIKIDNRQENGRIRLELYGTDAHTLLKSAVYSIAAGVTEPSSNEPVTWTAAGTGPLYIKTSREADGHGAGTDYDLMVYRPNLPREWVIQSVWNNICTEANAGSASAQLQLAYWHRTDLHHPKAPLFRSDLELDDRVSYMWYRLAEKNGAWGAKEGLDFISARLPPEEMAEAEQMFHNWQPGQCPSPTNIKYGLK